LGASGRWRSGAGLTGTAWWSAGRRLKWTSISSGKKRCALDFVPPKHAESRLGARSACGHLAPKRASFGNAELLGVLIGNFLSQNFYDWAKKSHFESEFWAPEIL